MKKYNVPTAAYGRFTVAEEAKAYVREQGAPIVVKTNGLAAGKGVILCDTVAEAEKAIDFMLVEGGFGAAGEPRSISPFRARILLILYWSSQCALPRSNRALFTPQAGKLSSKSF